MELSNTRALDWIKVSTTTVQGRSLLKTAHNRPGLTAELVGSKIYTFGGGGGYRGDGMSTMHILDIASNSWRDIQLPSWTARRDHVSFLWNDFFYVYSGWEGMILRDLFRIDLVSEGTAEHLECHWDGIDVLNFDYFTGCLCEPTRELVMFGGRLNGNFTSRTFCMRVDAHSFYEPKVKGKPPSPRQRHASCVQKNKVYVYGGEGSTDVTTDIHLLTIRAGQYLWSRIPSTIQGRLVEPRMLATGGRLFIIGGAAGRAGADLVVFSLEDRQNFSIGIDIDPSVDARRKENEISVNLKLPSLSSHAVVLDGNRIVCVGGYGINCRSYWMLQPRS